MTRDEQMEAALDEYMNIDPAPDGAEDDATILIECVPPGAVRSAAIALRRIVEKVFRAGFQAADATPSDDVRALAEAAQKAAELLRAAGRRCEYGDQDEETANTFYLQADSLAAIANRILREEV